MAARSAGRKAPAVKKTTGDEKKYLCPYCMKEKKKVTVLNILLTLMAFNFLARPDFIAYNYLYRDTLPVRLTTKVYSAPKFIWTVRNKSELNRAHDLGECPIFEKI